MVLTRREFIVATTTAAVTAALPATATASEPLPYEQTWIGGDPYRATVVEGGLGGRGFAEARDHAMRLRTPAEDRDRYVLGLEFSRA